MFEFELANADDTSEEYLAYMFATAGQILNIAKGLEEFAHSLVDANRSVATKLNGSDPILGILKFYIDKESISYSETGLIVTLVSIEMSEALNRG